MSKNTNPDGETGTATETEADPTSTTDAGQTPTAPESGGLRSCAAHPRRVVPFVVTRREYRAFHRARDAPVAYCSDPAIETLVASALRPVHGQMPSATELAPNDAPVPTPTAGVSDGDTLSDSPESTAETPAGVAARISHDADADPESDFGRVVVDARTGEELVIISSHSGSALTSTRRYHVPDASAVTDPQPYEPCRADPKGDDTEWVFAHLSAVRDRDADLCRWCDPEARAEAESRDGEQAQATMYQTLRDMTTEEFDEHLENHRTGGGGDGQ